METVADQFAQVLAAAGVKRIYGIGGNSLKTSTGFLNFGTELKNPNFAAMAEAAGIRGIRIEKPADVDEGIAAAFAHDGPVLGFTLYMIKAVMSGRGDEIIDLSKTNLRR